MTDLTSNQTIVLDYIRTVEESGRWTWVSEIMDTQRRNMAPPVALRTVKELLAKGEIVEYQIGRKKCYGVKDMDGMTREQCERYILAVEQLRDATERLTELTEKVVEHIGPRYETKVEKGHEKKG